jgi:uncharacterized membrane protein
MVAAAPPIAVNSLAFEMGAIVGLTIAVIISTAIPLTAGVAKGHVTLGIIAALITLPVAALLGCIGGLPLGCGLAFLINLIPKIERPLLSQAEIEAEMRKLRGY